MSNAELNMKDTVDLIKSLDKRMMNGQKTSDDARKQLYSKVLSIETNVVE